jgi:hypothetical protein
MSTDFERELRTEMEQAPIRPRTGVVREAYRRARRRQLATRATLAAGTAVVASIAATIAVTGLPGQQRIETTAYVISQVNDALAAASGDIVYIDQAGLDGAGTAGATYSAQPERIQYWAYSNQSRTLTTYDRSKTDVWDTVTQVKQGTEDALVNVSYQRRTVTKTATIFPRPPSQPGISCYGIPGGLMDQTGSGLIENASFLASIMHDNLRCAGSSGIGHQRFDGVEAIVLTGHSGVITWHLWINEATFLPIADGFSAPRGTGQGSSSERYAWLAPTAANLSTLTGPVPAGFTVTT